MLYKIAFDTLVPYGHSEALELLKSTSGQIQHGGRRPRLDIYVVITPPLIVRLR